MGCSTAGSARTEDEGEEHEGVFMSPMPPGGRVNTHVRFDDEGKPAWHVGCWVATLKFGGEAAARPTSMTLWHKCAEPAAAVPGLVASPHPGARRAPYSAAAAAAQPSLAAVVALSSLTR